MGLTDIGQTKESVYRVAPQLKIQQQKIRLVLGISFDHSSQRKIKQRACFFAPFAFSLRDNFSLHISCQVKLRGDISSNCRESNSCSFEHRSPNSFGNLFKVMIEGV